MRSIFVFLILQYFIFANELKKIDIKTLVANFKQEIKGERGAVPVIYEGKLYATLDNVKWEYTKPLKKEVYLEKKVAYIYEPHLNQVTVSTIKDNIDFLNIIKSAKNISGNNYEVTINGVKYNLLMKDSKPYALSYMDNLENQVYIVFENVGINTNIDHSVFQFQPPDDVEYIDAN